MRLLLIPLFLIPPVLGGCAAMERQAPLEADRQAAACRVEVQSLRAQLASETAERQKTVRAAERREEALRKQLEGLKAIERGIIDREDRIRTPTR